MQNRWGVIRRSGNYLPYSLAWALLYSDRVITEFVYSKEEANAIAAEINQNRMQDAHFLVRRNPQEFLDEVSPLDYHGNSAQRLSLIDSDAPPSPEKETYFAPTTRLKKYSTTGRPLKKPKIETIPGATPGVVAFVDYDIWPDGSVYVYYVATRRDQRQHGYMTQLLNKLLRRYRETAPYVNLGEIHSDSVLRFYQKKRQDDPHWAAHLKGKIRRNPDSPRRGPDVGADDEFLPWIPHAELVNLGNDKWQCPACQMISSKISFQEWPTGYKKGRYAGGGLRCFKPHLTIKNLSQGNQGRWQCKNCLMISGRFEDFEEVECSAKTPEPCIYCGDTPICALDCLGIAAALSGELTPDLEIKMLEPPPGLEDDPFIDN